MGVLKLGSQVPLRMEWFKIVQVRVLSPIYLFFFSLFFSIYIFIMYFYLLFFVFINFLG